MKILLILLFLMGSTAQAADVYFPDGRVCLDCVYKIGGFWENRLLFAIDKTGKRWLPDKGAATVGKDIIVHDPEEEAESQERSNNAANAYMMYQMTRPRSCSTLGGMTTCW